MLSRCSPHWVNVLRADNARAMSVQARVFRISVVFLVVHLSGVNVGRTAC
jgi:hypothetical protein